MIAGQRGSSSVCENERWGQIARCCVPTGVCWQRETIDGESLVAAGDGDGHSDGAEAWREAGQRWARRSGDRTRSGAC